MLKKQNPVAGELREKALPCNKEKCRLPNCFCSRSGREVPGGLNENQTPQMIIITFDDAVTDQAAQASDSINFKSIFTMTSVIHPS